MWTRGPLDQSPVAANPLGQQRGSFVFRWHADAQPLEVLKIGGDGQRDTEAIARVDRVFLQFRDEGNARILAASQFFRVMLRIEQQRRRRVDVPLVDAIDGTRHP